MPYNSNSRYEILTPDGWADFKGVMNKGVQSLITITLDDGRQVSATPQHIFFSDNERIETRNIIVGSRLDTSSGPTSVASIVDATADVVYDIVGVDNPEHKFLLSNGISTKNCDEFSFVPPNLQKEFWTSVQPTLATGGSCVITSTPKNDEDIFAQLWKGAEDNTDEFGNLTNKGVGKNGFFPLKVIWHEHPDRDETWAQPFRESLGEARFRQEFECEFVTDDETLVNSLTFSRLHPTEPEFFIGTSRWYHEPAPNKAYLVALDPSLGTNNDFAAIQVFQLPEMVQIAEWQANNLSSRHQVRILMDVLYALDSTLQDNPLQSGPSEIYWTFENNTIGEGVLTIIEDTHEDRFPGQLVTERRRKGLNMKRVRRGLNTTNRNKLSACARLKSLIESDRIKINSANLLRELKNYVAVGITFKAKSGEHDDLIAATLMIVRMLDIVLAWGTDAGDLREYINDDELLMENEPMPVVI